MPRRDVILTFLLVVAIGTLWGLNWPVIKLILTELPPLTVRAVAFPCATLLLIALALATGARLLPTRSEFAQLLLTGLFLVFGFNVLTTFGQLHTDASRAVLIAYTMPAMTAALAVVFLGERMHWPVALALAIGTLGIALLVLDDLSAVSSQLRGSTIMLLAALSWSIGNVLLKSRDWSISPLVLTTWCFGFSTLLAWPLVAIFEPLHEQLWPSGKTYWLLIYHVIGPMVICYALWAMLLRRTSATVAAISTLIAPLVGFSSSAWILDESISSLELIALVLIAVSISIALLRVPATETALKQS